MMRAIIKSIEVFGYGAFMFTCGAILAHTSCVHRHVTEEEMKKIYPETPTYKTALQNIIKDTREMQKDPFGTNRKLN